MRVTWSGFPGSGEYAEDNVQALGLEIDLVQKLFCPQVINSDAGRLLILVESALHPVDLLAESGLADAC